MRRVLRYLVPMLVATSVLAGVLAFSACDVPLGAIRRSPPTGIDQRVVSSKAPAPDIVLGGTAGSFRLADALAKEHVLLVFYRGHW